MFNKRLEELYSALKNASCTSSNAAISLNQAMLIAYDLLNGASLQKGKVYVIGNGGSSSIASHFVIDLLKTLGIAAHTISDASMLTCLSNDLGYENVYATPLKILLNPTDVLVAISSSGQSSNILKAVQISQESQAPVITLSGFLEDNPLRSMGNLNFYIDQSDYGLVEMSHFFILHSIVDLWKTIKIEKSKNLLQTTLTHAR